MKTGPFGTLLNPGKGWVPRLPGGFEWLWWAGRAVWGEVLGFRFQYPIELVPQAGPRPSLHYYVYSDRLFFDAMELDQDGVPFQRSRVLGRFYNPAYVAWYGLMALEGSLRAGGNPCEAFRIQAEWLIRHAVRRDDGSVVWPFPVDVQEGRSALKAPWISAMIQGLALSVLVRAHRLELGSPDLLNVCHAGVQVFTKVVSDGGVRSVEGGWAIYEEYPAYPLPRVLDGFLFSLLGLYDLWVETEDASVRQLFEDGVGGLVQAIDSWNYNDQWSWYGSHRYLCPPHYHNLNRLLLSALATATGKEILAHYAEVWDPVRLTPLERAKLFVTFIRLKQWSRVQTLVRQ